MKSVKLCLSSDCLSERLNDETVILNIESGLYHQLNETGTILWEKIRNSEPSFDELVSFAENNFNVKSIEKEISVFVEQLVKKDLLVKKEDQ